MIEFVTLNNSNGMMVTLCNWGARITSILFPSENGPKEMLLTYKNPEDFLTDEFYLGATCGRVSNRIANAQFELNGRNYILSQNDNGHCLHGGDNNLSKKFWDIDTAKIVKNSVRMTIHSPHLEEGFPGNVNIAVIYELTETNELRIQYSATTDMVTPINLTNHSYFTLGEDHCKDLRVQINACNYLKLNAESIPSGEILPLDNYLDFRAPNSIKQKQVVESNTPQSNTNKYDHCFVNKDNNHISATINSVKNNILMVLTTDQPSLQFYSGHQLNGYFTPEQGLCLEAQGYVDAVNHPQFPNIFIQPDLPYNRHILYKFSNL